MAQPSLVEPMNLELVHQPVEEPVWFLKPCSKQRFSLLYLSLSLFENLSTFMLLICCHGSNSDVRSKAFQAVDQFLQMVKQCYEKVFSELRLAFALLQLTIL